ncbi:NusG domain II-containing protein [Listeria grandensis]|uniref:NusG domain II-containing protein n=1 Tax=Listeria grandensis TaxID=1494963 RepID=UPI0016280173|nr:NusG domain II-containing protein [Listeria grandensis]MBC1474523.1 NusG domain II-containing protein [Listeria grandensis]
MKEYLHMVKRWDVIIVVFLTVLSFLPLAIFTYAKAQEPKPAPGSESKLVAVIKVDGNEYKRVDLTGHTGTDTFKVTTDDGDYNEIEVKGERIRISAADCNDQVCVRVGAIEKLGETIVCLPHKVVIEVQSTTGETEPDDGIVIPS